MLFNHIFITTLNYMFYSQAPFYYDNNDVHKIIYSIHKLRIIYRVLKFLILSQL